MTAKFYPFICNVGLAISRVVQAQSPAPGESPPESPAPAEKGASASPQAEKAASPSRAESPTASPKARPTPKKAKAEGKPPPAASPAGPATEKATNPQAPGGGPGLVWVNTEAGVYHGERSPFYGTTGKGKYMTEQDAIRAGYKRAPQGR